MGEMSQTVARFLRNRFDLPVKLAAKVVKFEIAENKQSDFRKIRRQLYPDFPKSDFPVLIPCHMIKDHATNAKTPQASISL